MMRRLMILTALTVFAGVAPAEDKVILKDGQTVTGDIQSESDTEIQIKSADEMIRVPIWAVERVEHDDSAPPERRPQAQPQEIEPSPALLEWVDDCIAKLGSDDDGVRASASVALRTIGAAARPALQKAVDGQDAVIAERAKKLLDQANRRTRKRPARQNRGKAKPATRTERTVLSIMKALDLSKEQEPSVEQILINLQDRQLEIRQSVRDGGVSREQAAEQTEALRNETNGKLHGVLTEAQMKKYLTWNRRSARADAAAAEPPEAAAKSGDRSK